MAEAAGRRATGRLRRQGLPAVLVFASVLLPGCATYSLDEITSREFHIKDLFKKAPDPIWVLEHSTDGDVRSKALRSLKEPLQHGGTREQQDKVVALLCNAATQEAPVCRLAALETLRTFKDPRIVEPLKTAYYQQGNFNPDTVTVIRRQALAALGDIKQPTAVDLLIRVVKEPPFKGVGEDRQITIGERIAAAQALSNYPQYQVAEALVDVLKNEQNIALRDAVNNSLKTITGKDFPAEAQVWADYLHRSATEKDTGSSPGMKEHLLRLVGFHPKD